MEKLHKYTNGSMATLDLLGFTQMSSTVKPLAPVSAKSLEVGKELLQAK